MRDKKEREGIRKVRLLWKPIRFIRGSSCERKYFCFRPVKYFPDFFVCSQTRAE